MPIAQCRYTCGTCTTAGKLTHESMGTHEPEGGEWSFAVPLHTRGAISLAHEQHMQLFAFRHLAAQHADGLMVQVLMWSWCGCVVLVHMFRSTDVHLAGIHMPLVFAD